jgi:hypothetical protein
MPEVSDENVPVQDELDVLKKRATMMGVKYHPTISLEKLREKVSAAMEGASEPEPVQREPGKESTGERNARLRKESAKLVRIRVTCMNPNKKEHEGEIFTASNSVVGTFKKYVPFNTEDGWHVPTIIYKMICDRKCQVFFTAKGPRGNKIRKGKLIKEFNVELLPDLTPEELHELATKQAMANNI